MLDKLPRTIRIAGKDIKIIIRGDGLLAEADAWARYVHAKCAIELDPEMPNSVFAANCIIHEIFHGIFDAWELRATDEEERTVSAFANGWTQVLRDNPALVRWLAAVLK